MNVICSCAGSFEVAPDETPNVVVCPICHKRWLIVTNVVLHPEFFIPEPEMKPLPPNSFRRRLRSKWMQMRWTRAYIGERYSKEHDRDWILGVSAKQWRCGIMPFVIGETLSSFSPNCTATWTSIITPIVMFLVSYGVAWAFWCELFRFLRSPRV